MADIMQRYLTELKAQRDETVQRYLDFDGDKYEAAAARSGLCNCKTQSRCSKTRAKFQHSCMAPLPTAQSVIPAGKPQLAPAAAGQLLLHTIQKRRLPQHIIAQILLNRPSRLTA